MSFECRNLLCAILEAKPESHGEELVSGGVTTAGIIPMQGGRKRCSVSIHGGLRVQLDMPLDDDPDLLVRCSFNHASKTAGLVSKRLSSGLFGCLMGTGIVAAGLSSLFASNSTSDESDDSIFCRGEVGENMAHTPDCHAISGVRKFYFKPTCPPSQTARDIKSTSVQ